MPETPRIRRRMTHRSDDHGVTVNVTIVLEQGKAPEPVQAPPPAPPAPSLPLPIPPPPEALPEPPAPPVAPPAPVDPKPIGAWYTWPRIAWRLRRVGHGLLRVMGRIGLELQADAKHFYKFLTFWGFVILMSAPDLYNLAIESHLIDGKVAPAKLTYFINLIAFMGAAGKIVKVRKSQEG